MASFNELSNSQLVEEFQDVMEAWGFPQDAYDRDWVDSLSLVWFIVLVLTLNTDNALARLYQEPRVHEPYLYTLSPRSLVMRQP